MKISLKKLYKEKKGRDRKDKSRKISPVVDSATGVAATIRSWLLQFSCPLVEVMATVETCQSWGKPTEHGVQWVMYIQVQVGVPNHLPLWWGSLHDLNTVEHGTPPLEGPRNECGGTSGVFNGIWHLPRHASRISAVEPIMSHQKECPNTLPDFVGLSQLCKGGLWQDKKTLSHLGGENDTPAKHPADSANGPLFWVVNH